MPELKRSLAWLCLTETKLSRTRLGQRLELAPAESFKRYPISEKVPLPREFADSGANLWEILQNRRSRRKYSGGHISLNHLAALCWAAQGITARAGEHYLRTAPSAGALYPIETYIAVAHVKDIKPGIFHFDVAGFQLERISLGNPMNDIADACLGQAFMKQASVIFIFSAVIRRTLSKYGNRGMRYIFMDVGHIAENLLLATEAMGFKACPVAAFFDDEMNQILGIQDQEETVVYLVPVGR